MRNKYYPNLIQHIKPRLKKKFPAAKPERNRKNIPGHLLWMMAEMQTFTDSAKAGRWIGWIIAQAEILGVITEKQSRRLAKKDSHQGYI
jgi:hypothetical protein